LLSKEKERLEELSKKIDRGIKLTKIESDEFYRLYKKSSEEWSKSHKEWNKQRLAKMTLEQRKRELEWQRKISERTERRVKKRKELESKLTKNELDLRHNIEKIISFAHKKTRIHLFRSREQMKQYINTSQRQAAKLMKELLENTSDDLEEIKKILLEEELEDFEPLYKRYKDNKRPLLWKSTAVIPEDIDNLMKTTGMKW
jgi:hypothetical protein